MFSNILSTYHIDYYRTKVYNQQHITLIKFSLNILMKSNIFTVGNTLLLKIIIKPDNWIDSGH